MPPTQQRRARHKTREGLGESNLTEIIHAGGDEGRSQQGRWLNGVMGTMPRNQNLELGPLR